MHRVPSPVGEGGELERACFGLTTCSPTQNILQGFANLLLMTFELLSKQHQSCITGAVQWSALHRSHMSCLTSSHSGTSGLHFQLVSDGCHNVLSCRHLLKQPARKQQSKGIYIYTYIYIYIYIWVACIQLALRVACLTAGP